MASFKVCEATTLDPEGTNIVISTTPVFHIYPQGHIGEVFVLESHPSDPRILLSAGHEGYVIFWDMLAGIKLKSLYLEGTEGPECVFDCKFSPDGLTCAAVDSYGFLTIFGFGSDEPYNKVSAPASSKCDDPLPNKVHCCLVKVVR